MALEIPMEDYAKKIQQRNNERLEILKANTKEFENPQHPTMLMDRKLYDAAKGDVDNFITTLQEVSEEKRLSLSTIFGQAVSSSGNSLLHEAARFGNKEIVELIAHHFPFLLTRTNILGDTALHVATKAKKSNIIDVLIKVIPREDYELLRMKNHHGNTALLEAVINGYCDGVKCLFSADHQMAHHLNKDGKSPLCLAAEYDKKDEPVLGRLSLSGKSPAVEYDKKNVLEFLLGAVGDDELVGRTRVESPIYAALTRKKSGMFEEILKKRRILFDTRDEKGNTALHFAASIGNLEGVNFLLNNFSEYALERNKMGDFPIHVASKKGHVKIVKELLQRQWPDPTELLNNEGQNILHVAAKNGRKGVVKYMLRNTQLRTLLINAKDKNGNTPLHLASTNLHANVLVSLTWEKTVDLELKNNDGMTAVDLCLQRMIDTLDIPTTASRKALTFCVLNSAGTPKTEKGRNIWRRLHKKPRNMDIMKEQTNSLALVALLVATVTFAAGFTVPGGFNSSDTVAGQGMAILVNRKIFHVFIICDTIAMFCSAIATFTLLWAQVGDIFFARSAIIFALYFTSIALFTMSLAFMSAVYLVVSKLAWLANVVLIMGTIFLTILFVIIILTTLPIGLRNPVFHFLCHYIVPLLTFFTKNSGKVVEDKQQEKSQPMKDDKQEELQEMKVDKQVEK